MTRTARTSRLADLYEQATVEMDEAVQALETLDKPRALAAMARVAVTMTEIGEAIVDGPLLPLLRVH